jgi:hypothetical protein
MKKEVIFCLALLLSIGKIYAWKNHHPGDTIIVKMKNKNKVMILSDNEKDRIRLKEIPFMDIMQRVDSTIKRMDSVMNIKLEVDVNDGDMDLSGLSAKPNVRIIRKFRKSDQSIGQDEDVEIMVLNDDTVKKQIFRKREVQKQKIRFFSGDGFDSDLFEMDLGFNNYLEKGKLPADAAADYGLSPFNSNIVNLRWMKKIIGKKDARFCATIGLEFSWNNYKFDQNAIINKDSTGVIFAPFQADQKKIKSKLSVSWLNVPLMFHYHSKKSSFHLAAGAFAGYRLGSHSKTKYSEDGAIRKEKNYTNFYLNSLQYGLRFQLGFYDVDFFATYQLNELFSKGKGPALIPFSFGITI